MMRGSKKPSPTREGGGEEERISLGVGKEAREEGSLPTTKAIIGR